MTGSWLAAAMTHPRSITTTPNDDTDLRRLADSKRTQPKLALAAIRIRLKGSRWFGRGLKDHARRLLRAQLSKLSATPINVTIEHSSLPNSIAIPSHLPTQIADG